MRMLRITCLLFALVVSATVVGQETNVLDEQLFGFEVEDSWTSNSESGTFTVADEKSASGDKGLKFTIADNNRPKGIYSVNTGSTLHKVRTAINERGSYVVGSNYDGVVMGLDYDGGFLWRNELSGFMVHDIWCEDLTGDGIDEIIVANADSYVYCLDGEGNLLWKYKNTDAPMYAVCAIKKNGTSYVVAGSLNTNMYYLTTDGELVKEIPSSTYSDIRPWGTGIIPPRDTHYTNFIRKYKRLDGTEVLVINATNNHMQVSGKVYQFEALADLPFTESSSFSPDVIGYFAIEDPDGDGEPEILIGTSGHQNTTYVTRYDVATETAEAHKVQDTHSLNFGYRMVHTTYIPDGNSFKYLFFVGNTLLIVPPNADFKSGFQSGAKRIDSKYAYNDLWRDPTNGKIVLAGSQSGGSAFHVIDPSEPEWELAFKNLDPPGNIHEIISNTNELNTQVSSFTKPAWERDPLPVYFMTQSLKDNTANQVAQDIMDNYDSPIFLASKFTNKAENWDRSSLGNAKYRDRRDGRRQYTLTQQESIDLLSSFYGGNPHGAAYWGGHGTDPYMFQRSTLEAIMDQSGGRKTVLIYPELEDHSEDFTFVMNDHFYPLAEHARLTSSNIFVRGKNIFWQNNVHLHMWDRLLSGEFADVFVPSMEETTDKSMDLSISGRLGVWASGAVDSWGTRAVPDNTSFDRSRQISHQRLPNHFLRMMVYHLSYGVQYLNNLPVDEAYMSVLWKMIAKGALYVPKKSEILSFSPVHLSIVNPDDRYSNEGTNVKWSTFFNQEAEDQNPMVFSRLNASWMGAPVTEWDFSRYAAGVKDRRLNFLPNYPNGMVMMTPPQQGTFAETDLPRGAMTDHIHPIYENIMSEYITDGRDYISSDGSQRFAANEYYSTIEQEIIDKADLLPLTVKGEVAWVVAQTSPTHLRLTLIDGGYINPSEKTATVTFNSVNPIGMTDLMSEETFDVSNTNSLEIEVPTGLFRFIDIELDSPLE